MARDVEAGKAFVRVSVKDDMGGLKNISSKLKSWGAGLAGLGGGIAGVAAAVRGPMIAMAQGFADTGGEIDDMSQRTGVAAENLQALGYAAGMSGASLEDVEKAIRKMQQNGMSADQIGAVADKIAGMADPAERTAYAMDVFGKSGATLIPMLSGGSAGLAKFRAEAERLGLIMSSEDVTASAELGDSLDRVKLTLKGLTLQIGAAVAPAMTELSTRIAEIVSRAIAFLKANRPLIATISKIAGIVFTAGTVIAGLGTALAIAGAAVGGIVSAISTVGAVIGAVLSPIGLLIGLIAGGTAAFITFTDTGRWLAESLMADFGAAFGSIKEAFGGIVDALKAGDLRLAAEIALTGVKLAFFEATKSIRTWWIEMNKSLVSACLYAVKFVIVKWRQVSEWVAGKLAEFMYYFNLLTAGQADYLTPGERESAITGSLDAYYDDLQNRLEKLADDVGSAMQSSLDQALTDGEQRIEALRGELNALRTTAAAEAAALGERTGAPTPTAVRNAIEAGVGATTGTFSAAGAQVAFAAVGNEQWQRQTAENTERTARNLEKIIRRNFDPYEFFGFGPP